MFKYLIALLLVAAVGGGVYYYITYGNPFEPKVTPKSEVQTVPSVKKTSETAKVTPPPLDTSDVSLDKDLTDLEFDYDIYKILRRFMYKENFNRQRIYQPSQQPEQLLSD